MRNISDVRNKTVCRVKKQHHHLGASAAIALCLVLKATR
jgi:hypothetical protein